MTLDALIIQLGTRTAEAMAMAVRLGRPGPTHMIVGSRYWDALAEWIALMTPSKHTALGLSFMGLTVLRSAEDSPVDLLAFGVSLSAMREGGW